MTGRTYLLFAALAAAVVGIPARADVKVGIDAYQRGDFAAAVSSWRPLAIAGDADAQYNIGQAYRLGRGVPVDPQMAESWFKKAADQGHDRARNAYGLTLFQGGRRQEAIPYIEEAAGSGFPQSQYVYATLLFNGDMVEKDWVRSYALMTRAAAGDVAAAKAGIAQLDRYIPHEQRQRGLRLASVFESAAPKAPDTVGGPIAAPSPAVARPAITPVIAAAPVATETKVVKMNLGSVASPAAGGRWRIQLGAFANAAGASSLWRLLQGRVGALAPLSSFVVPAGSVTRLQAGPLASRAAADRLCASVRSSGNGCLVVAP